MANVPRSLCVYGIKYPHCIVPNCRTATCPTCVSLDENVPSEADLFDVCLLATDKEDTSMYKLLKFNVSTSAESLITEIPYRRDCAIAFLMGKSQANVSPKIMRLCRIDWGST